MPPKTLSHAPRNPTRRSREERETLNKLETERRQVRADATAASAAAEAAGRRPYHSHGAAADERWRASTSRGHGLGGSLKYVRGGRGGFIGQRPRPEKKPRASGQPEPASAATAAVAAFQPSPRGGRSSGPQQRRRGRAAIADGAAAAAPVVKADPDGAASGLLDPKTAKLEDEFGNGSSDDEAALGQNVEYINLVSDDEQPSDPDREGPVDGPAPPSGARRHVDMFQPLRMKRKPHRDRNLPFGMEVLSGTGVSRRDTKSRARPQSDASLAEFIDGKEGTARKGTSTIRKDSGGSAIIKQESGPLRATRTSGRLGLLEDDDDDDDDDAEQAIEESDVEVKDQAVAKPPGQRRASRPSTKRPTFITAQDRLEYMKQQQDLEDMRNELGGVYGTDVRAKGAKAATNDTTEDIEDDELPDPKAGAVYLFQLPPILPDLFDPSNHPQPKPDPSQGSKKGQAHASKASGSNPSDPIKLEHNDTAFDGLYGPSNFSSRTPALPAGLAGQLRVRKSGRTTLTWAGTNMEVNLGLNPYFLQTVVLADVREAEGHADGTNGTVAMDVDGDVDMAQDASRPEAVSFGQLRGKFVVTPDWNEILG